MMIHVPMKVIRNVPTNIAPQTYHANIEISGCGCIRYLLSCFIIFSFPRRSDYMNLPPPFRKKARHPFYERQALSIISTYPSSEKVKT
jgi:hypothetical protein